MNVSIESSWLEILKDEFEKDYMKDIKSFLVKQIEAGKTIYPNPKNIFKAFDKTPFDKVKVVILWQDPYHWPNQAQGFCFSVQNGTKLPPSLQNIYKELERSLWIKPSLNWDLTIWSEQWVFLLNAILTVEWWKPASHSQIGWEKFTDEVIKQISEKKENVVFLLWWAFAQSKEKLIDEKRHFILKTTHPSPFSAHRWFIWSDCFKKTNEILEKIWKKPINWEIKS